jgi:hypothetical protein
MYAEFYSDFEGMKRFFERGERAGRTSRDLPARSHREFELTNVWGDGSACLCLEPSSASFL